MSRTPVRCIRLSRLLPVQISAAILTLAVTKLQSLRELYVYDTKLTSKGIATLRKNLPMCQLSERSNTD